MKKRRPLNQKDKRPDSANFNTSNPRHLRGLRLLMIRPVKREELDKVAGCSNAPELVAELRRRGLEIPCTRLKCLDRDGKECRPGIYHLTEKDRRVIYRWLAKRQKGSIDLSLAGLIALLGVCALLLLGVM